jgi:aryl carrier-like protein
LGASAAPNGKTCLTSAFIFSSPNTNLMTTLAKSTLSAAALSCAIVIALTSATPSKTDWPQWGGQNERNFISSEKGMPVKMNPGKQKQGSEDIDMSTTENCLWVAKLGSQAYGTCSVSDGKVLVGTNNESPRSPKHIGDRGIVMCFDEKTGAFKWQLAAPKLGEAHVYRTGDFVRWTQDGQLAFLGRRDGLVKINGHRVDLAGIEAALRTVPEVGDIGAFVRSVGGLKAIAVAAALNAGADAAQSVTRLRAAALSLLPASHQPKDIQILPALVRTPNGKIDRQALAQGIASPVSGPTGPALPVATPAPAATHTPLVETIAAIWADVLHRERVAVDKGIFDLGADSLHIFRIASRMSDAGIAVTSRRLLSNPSVLMLAAEHESPAAPAQSGASVLPLASFRRDRRTS